MKLAGVFSSLHFLSVGRSVGQSVGQSVGNTCDLSLSLWCGACLALLTSRKESDQLARDDTSIHTQSTCVCPAHIITYIHTYITYYSRGHRSPYLLRVHRSAVGRRTIVSPLPSGPSSLSSEAESSQVKSSQAQSSRVKSSSNTGWGYLLYLLHGSLLGGVRLRIRKQNREGLCDRGESSGGTARPARHEGRSRRRQGEGGSHIVVERGRHSPLTEGDFL